MDMIGISLTNNFVFSILLCFNFSRCALQYHETYKMGCRMSIHFSNYATNQLYLVRIRILVISSILTCKTITIIKSEWINSAILYCKSFQDALHKCYNSAWATSAMPVNPDDSYFGRGQMRCLPNGNFDPLQVTSTIFRNPSWGVPSNCENLSFQCVDRDMTNGMCLCVAFSFGQMILNSTLAPREETEELNCFDATIHYSGYYRPCERIVYEVNANLWENMDLVESNSCGFRFKLANSIML